MSTTKKVEKMDPRDYLKQPYARILIPSDDGTYFAEILEFPGCFAQGDTPGQAIEKLESVALDWLRAALELKQQIPTPNVNIGYSGRIALRLPRSIHKRASLIAQRDDTSLNQFLVSAISASVGAQDFYDRLIERLEARFFPTARTLYIFSREFILPWSQVHAALQPQLTGPQLDQTRSNDSAFELEAVNA